MVLDEFTRECLALQASRRFDSQQVKNMVAELIASHGVRVISSDNGPEFLAQHFQN